MKHSIIGFTHNHTPREETLTRSCGAASRELKVNFPQVEISFWRGRVR